MIFHVVEADSTTTIPTPTLAVTTTPTATPTLVVTTAPIPTFSYGPSSGPVPLTVRFYASPQANYYWWFGDGATSTLQNPSHTYTSPGTYDVTLGADNTQNQRSPAVVITVTTQPVANFDATPTTGQAPLLVKFSDTSTNSPTIWNWNFGDGTSSSVQNPTHTFNAGSYTVTLTASNSGGSSTQQKTIDSYMQVSFRATPLSGAAPLLVSFTDTSTSNPTGWGWSFGDGTTSNIQNPTHFYNVSGVYIVTLNLFGETPGVGTYSNAPNNPASSTITILSPLAPGTTTSPTPSLNQTATITTSTTVTTQTTLPAVTMAQTVTATPSGFYYTPRPTVTTTQKIFTPIPTSTPTQKSPFGIEFSILAISAAILIVRSQYQKP